MSLSNSEIRDAATHWLQQHGDDSVAAARRMRDLMVAVDTGAAEIWARIERALVGPGEPLIPARH